MNQLKNIFGLSLPDFQLLLERLAHKTSSFPLIECFLFFVAALACCRTKGFFRSLLFSLSLIGLLGTAALRLVSFKLGDGELYPLLFLALMISFVLHLVLCTKNTSTRILSSALLAPICLLLLFDKLYSDVLVARNFYECSWQEDKVSDSRSESPFGVLLTCPLPDSENVKVQIASEELWGRLKYAVCTIHIRPLQEPDKPPIASRPTA